MKTNRCTWVNQSPLYIAYHDTEWGVPIWDDHTMFEFLILETFQAGLSWYVVLKKRENFRRAFAQFDFEKVAEFNEQKIEQLIKDEGIIRNKLKIKAAITNAQAFIKIREEYGTFCDYFWQFTNGKPIVNHWKSIKDVPATTTLSDTISKDLKKEGSNL